MADAVVIGHGRLDDDLGGFPARRSAHAHHPHQALERPLPRAIISLGEKRLGVEDPHQGDGRKSGLMSKELGPEEDVDPAPGGLIQDTRPVTAARRRIRIKTGDPARWKPAPHFFLQRFDTPLPAAEVLLTAARTEGRSRAFETAIPADELVIPLVECQGNIAVRTLGNMTAPGADERGGISPAVQKNDHLFFPGQPAPYGFLQDAADDRVLPGHIDEGDLPRAATGLDRDEKTFGLGPVKPGHGGGGRPKHGGSALDAGPDHDPLPGVESGALGLDERFVLLLIANE